MNCPLLPAVLASRMIAFLLRMLGMYHPEVNPEKKQWPIKLTTDVASFLFMDTSDSGSHSIFLWDFVLFLEGISNIKSHLDC